MSWASLEENDRAFSGEIISDMKDGILGRRIPGARVKHRVKENWLKMYDKAGSVLRIEMVINNPEEFKVRKQVTRKKRQAMEWVPMRKGVAYLFRYREFSRQANDRYLDALAVVDDPTTAIQRLDESRHERKLNPAVGCGHSIHFLETTFCCSKL
jgi:hypothetical protein